MMARRSRLQIYQDVLQAIKDGTEKPTLIMDRTRLPYSTLNNTLSLLVSQGNIEVSMASRRKLYRITQKGENTLDYFEQFKPLFQLE